MHALSLRLTLDHFYYAFMETQIWKYDQHEREIVKEEGR